jgi:integrase/recombinase XerD
MARKAPAGCYWREGVLWGRAKVKGKDIRWSLHTDDPALAKTRRAAGKDRAVADRYHGDAVLLLEEVIEAWGPWVQQQVGKRTYDRYLSSLEQLAPFLAGLKLSEVDGRLISEIIRERIKVVTNATVKRDLGALSSVMNFAMDHYGVEENPVLPRLGRIKERRDPINLPHDEDIALVKSRAPGLWPYLVDAALKSGCREDELIKATRRDLDDKRKELTVIAKGNKRRVIDLSWDGGFELFDSIPAFAGKPWLFWRHEDKRVRKDNAKRGSDRKPTFRGDQIEDPAAVFLRITLETEAWAKENGVQFVRFRFHDLRHRHCVDYLKSGGNIFDLQQRVGHSSIKQTEEYLKHISPEQARIAKYGPGLRRAA